MGLLDLFIVALVPVLKILLVTGVGCFLATDRIKLLSPEARRYLNNLVFFVFSPSLVGSNLAETITFDSLVSLWFMPVNILLTFIIGSALAWLLIKITKTPPHLQGLIIGCCSAGNLGNLLLILVPAVCEESNSPFGDSSVCSSYGEAYASLSMAIGAVYIWTYMFNIMRMFLQNRTESDGDISVTNGSGEASETLNTESYRETLLPLIHSADQVELTVTSSGRTKQVQFWKKTIQFIKRVAEKINLKRVFAPSTIAALVGFFIGTISPVRKLMIGDDAPLSVIDSSVALLGEASIPSMTLILGANLLQGLKRSEVGPLVILGIIVVRNVVLPLLGVVIVKAAYHFGLVGTDSLYLFVLMLQYALPPAMAAGTMTQLFGAGQSECSVILLWAYVVAVLSLTLWCTFFMWILA